MTHVCASPQTRMVVGAPTHMWFCLQRDNAVEQWYQWQRKNKFTSFMDMWGDGVCIPLLPLRPNTKSILLLTRTYQGTGFQYLLNTQRSPATLFLTFHMSPTQIMSCGGWKAIFGRLKRAICGMLQPVLPGPGAGLPPPKWPGYSFSSHISKVQSRERKICQRRARKYCLDKEFGRVLPASHVGISAGNVCLAYVEIAGRFCLEMLPRRFPPLPASKNAKDIAPRFVSIAGADPPRDPGRRRCPNA